MSDIYLTPEKEASSELVEKRSKFIGNIKHINSEEEALFYIKKIKKEHYDANHNVYAYIFYNGKFLEKTVAILYESVEHIVCSLRCKLY